jgi:hypothetical protein
LWVVPAVHFRVAFAERVNQLCSDRNTRPDAIAVELGAQATAAAAAWLGELGVGPSRRTKLPCMLGLASRNRRIKASKRDLAVRLQIERGCELTELPPELLRELLGYSGFRVLYLSPTDSIVEAIRCALELEVPLYGVDLDESAEGERSDGVFQTPPMPGEQIERYVQENARYAGHQRDEEVDSRREIAMVARLKTMLNHHRRVLLTCGLAHWLPIQKLLSDSTLQPAPIPPPSAVRRLEFYRTVIHPALAVYYMDLFPACAKGYEQHRRPANVLRKPLSRAKTTDLLTRMLRAACEKHFGRKDAKQQLDRLGEDWEALHDFEQLLAHLTLVRQQSVPDLFTILMAAQGTMTAQFCGVLASKLMEFNWAKPKSHPGSYCLVPPPVAAGKFVRGEFIGPKGQKDGYCYVTSVPGGVCPRLEVPIPWRWEGAQLVGQRPRYDERRTWTPWDRLMTAMSLRAREVARSERERPRIEVFEGSLLDGVHMKSTLRAHIRGENRVYVHDRRQPSSPAPKHHDGWPIVWVFRLEADNLEWGKALEWLHSFEGRVRNPALLHQVARDHRDASIWIVHAGRPAAQAQDPHRLIWRTELNGILLYAPTHFTLHQAARWAEDTGYRRMPVCHSYESVETFFQTHHRLDAGAGPWYVSLVRMAIPYASTAVTIVAPDGLALPPAVFEEARQRGVQVRIVPLSYFPREMLRRMSSLLFVPVKNDPETQEYSYVEYAEQVLGESVTAGRDLLPAYWLNYALRGS